MNRNVVELSGRLVSDVQTRELPSGSKVANFSIATTRIYYNKDKEKQEETTFVDCEMFGPRVDHLAQYGAKGRNVFIDGRLRQDKWEDKEGGKRQKTLVVVEDFDWLDFREQNNEGGDTGKQSTERKPVPNKNARTSTDPKGKGAADVEEEDIPF